MSGADLIPFTYEGHQVRTVQIDDEPWFVAADVCTVLGYAHVGSALRALRDREKGVRPTHTLGGQQDVTIISEPGLYRLIMRSNRPEAEAFQDWVTTEVLPAIRKTGQYGERELTRLEIIDIAREAELARIEERAGRLAAEAQVAELEPDAARARRTMDADGLALVGTVAKRFGVKETALRQFLHAEGLLIRDGNRRNEPYARYIESGHFELKTRLVGADPDRAPQERSTTFVTPKGEALIWKRLYDAGYVSSPIQPPRQLELVLGGGASPVLPLGPSRAPGGAA